MRSGTRYSFAVLAFAVLMTVFFVVGIQLNWGIFRQPTKEDVSNPDAINEFALEEGAVDLAALDLNIAVVPPSSGDEVRALEFRLDQLQLYVRDDDDTVAVTEVCLDYLSLLFQPQQEETTVFSWLIEEPYCVPVTETDYYEEEFDFVVYTLDRFYWVTPRLPAPFSARLDDPDLLNLNFWYPYDGFQLDLVLQAQYSVTLDNGEQVYGTINPYIEWDIQTSGTRLWDIALKPSPDLAIDPVVVRDSLGEDQAYDAYSITFNRLLLYRIIFPFFMVAMVLLLCFMPLFNERDSLIDVSAAMLFGIFGLKGIIGPGEQMGQTVMDIALIGLYVLLAFAVLLFFIRRLLSKNDPAESEG